MYDYLPRNESARYAPKRDVKYDKKMNAWYKAVAKSSAGFCSMPPDTNKCFMYNERMAREKLKGKNGIGRCVVFF